MANSTPTPYGFTWGPMAVTRIMEYRGRRVLGIETHRRKVEVHVSPKGDRVRVWIDGEEVT